MPTVPVFLLALCLLLVIGGLVLLFVKPGTPQAGITVAFLGVILYFVMLLAHAR